jgi:nucleotide-binding universal stress UspA family protein
MEKRSVTMFKKIAVAFDESPEAGRAFRSALDLAKLTGAELTLITVIEHLPAYISYVTAEAPDVPALLQEKRRAFYADLHRKAKETAQGVGINIHIKTIENSEIRGLLQLIDDCCPDLLVLGLRREQTGFSGFAGTAHRLALHAKCDLLGIR